MAEYMVISLKLSWKLFGPGVSSILGSFFSAYPTTGSFSRSAVNHESGAKSGVSGSFTGIIMGCALIFLTSLFEYIPQVCILVGNCCSYRSAFMSGWWVYFLFLLV